MTQDDIIRIARRESVNRIRVRIMQEAYDLADRDDSEGYNSVKVMCSDVLGMINELLDERQWQGLTDEDIMSVEVLRYHFAMNGGNGPVSKKGRTFIEAVEAKLKEKNT